MGWGHNYILIRFNKDDDDEWDATYISIKDFYVKSEQQLLELKSVIPFPDLISAIIVEFVIPIQYNGIYVLKEVEWRSDIMRTVTGLSKCFMFPDYTYIMLLTLKASLSSLSNSLYYTVIKGKWALRTDQANFREWHDPIQSYINSLGPWRPGDEPPKSVKSAKHIGGFVSFELNQTPEDEHPKARQQYMENQKKSHYKKLDCNHILFEIEHIKSLESALPSDEELNKYETKEERESWDKQRIRETFNKLKEMDWKPAKTKSGENKIIDWPCCHLDFVNQHNGIKSKCGGGCFGPRNPNWCENPVYSVNRKLWRKGIFGRDISKSYWETDQDVNDPHQIIVDND